MYLYVAVRAKAGTQRELMTRHADQEKRKCPTLIMYVFIMSRKNALDWVKIRAGKC